MKLKELKEKLKAIERIVSDDCEVAIGVWRDDGKGWEPMLLGNIVVPPVILGYENSALGCAHIIFLKEDGE